MNRAEEKTCWLESETPFGHDEGEAYGWDLNASLRSCSQ